MKTQKRNRIISMILAALLALVIAVGTVVPALADTVNTDGVNIRNAASAEGDNIIGSLNKGDEFTVEKTVTDAAGTNWCYIRLANGNYGYIRADLVTQTNAPAPAQEQAPAPAPAQEEAPAAEPEKEQEETAQPAEEAAKEETAPAENVQEDVTLSDYDPSTDKDAHYELQFVEGDGSGRWYVFNYDTGSRVAVSDLQKISESQSLAESNAARASRLKVAVIVLVILLILLVLFIIWMMLGGSMPELSRRERRTRPVLDDDGDDFDDEDFDDEDDDFQEGDETEDDEPLDDEDDEYDDEDDEDADDFDDEEEEDEDGDDFDGEDEDDDRPARRSAGRKRSRSIFDSLFARRTPARRSPRTRRPVRIDFDEAEDYPEDIELLPDDDIELTPPPAEEAPAAPAEVPAAPAAEEAPAAPAPEAGKKKAAPTVEIDFDEEELELDFLDSDD